MNKLNRVADKNSTLVLTLSVIVITERVSQ